MSRENSQSTGYAEQLAGFITRLDLDTVPMEVVGHAKYLLLDLLGAALAGIDTSEAEAAFKAVGLMFPGEGACTLWGTSKKTSPNGAALFNGILAHARELDDFGGADHSGAVIVPALLAVAEAYPLVSGKTFLEAMIAGYEVARRVLESGGGYRPHNHGDGYHSTGTCGSFGAAAAVAKALGLGVEETTWALGLAGSFTGAHGPLPKMGPCRRDIMSDVRPRPGLPPLSLQRAALPDRRISSRRSGVGFFRHTSVTSLVLRH
jgi:2-methylcitrate dehydratase PrpD